MVATMPSKGAATASASTLRSQLGGDRLLALDLELAVVGVGGERLPLEVGGAARVLELERRDLGVVLRLLVLDPVDEPLDPGPLGALLGALRGAQAQREQFDCLVAAERRLARRDPLAEEVGAGGEERRPLLVEPAP